MKRFGGYIAKMFDQQYSRPSSFMEAAAVYTKSDDALGTGIQHGHTAQNGTVWSYKLEITGRFLDITN